MNMPRGKQAESGRFARAVSAEIRASMGRQRLNGVQLAGKARMSRDYLGKRLRNEAPFTLNDIEAICKALGEDLGEFLIVSVRNTGSSL